MRKIIVTSANRAVNKAKVDNQLDLSILSLYNLASKQLDFLNSLDLSDARFKHYIDAKKSIMRFQNSLIYKYPKELCNYKITSVYNNDTSGLLQPSAIGVTINLFTNESYTFKPIDFITNYQGYPFSKIRLYLNQSSGNYYYNNILVIGVIEIKVSDIGKLVYKRTTNAVFNDSIKFKVYDIYNNYTNYITNTIQGTAIITNMPATIGDNTIYVGNRTETILTLDMFTNQLSPPYNDPENDLIDAIRIDEISESNEGAFYLNGNEISVNMIITREDLSNNLFKHIGPNKDSINSDVFNFSARDEGSQIWVQ